MRTESRIAKLESQHAPQAPFRVIPLLGPNDPEVEDWPDHTPQDGVRSIRLVGVEPEDVK